MEQDSQHKMLQKSPLIENRDIGTYIKLKTTKYDRMLELIQIYKCVIINGKFQRMYINKCTGFVPHISEGRWYGELTRANKHGRLYDWKTILIHVIVNYMGVITVKNDILSFLEELSILIHQSQHRKDKKLPEIQIQSMLRHLYQTIRLKSNKHLEDMDKFYTRNQCQKSPSMPNILPLVSPSSSLLIIPPIPKYFPQQDNTAYSLSYQQNKIGIQKIILNNNQIFSTSVTKVPQNDIVHVQKGDQSDFGFYDLFE